MIGERHYSLQEVAEMLNFSVEKIRRMFADVPGVVRDGHANDRRNKRRYVNVRIPASVLNRVYQQLCRRTV